MNKRLIFTLSIALIAVIALAQVWRNGKKQQADLSPTVASTPAAAPATPATEPASASEAPSSEAAAPAVTEAPAETPAPAGEPGSAAPAEEAPAQ